MCQHRVACTCQNHRGTAGEQMSQSQVLKDGLYGIEKQQVDRELQKVLRVGSDENGSAKALESILRIQKTVEKYRS